MYINFVDKSHTFLSPLLKTTIRNYILYAFLKVDTDSVATQLRTTPTVTLFLLTYRTQPTPLTVRSDTRYRIQIFSCYSHIHITKQHFTNCDTQIMKRKEMLCTAIFCGA